jgi:hypothetical protein
LYPNDASKLVVVVGNIERGILRVSSSGIQSWVTYDYLIPLQTQLINFGKRVTACLPTV